VVCDYCNVQVRKIFIIYSMSSERFDVADSTKRLVTNSYIFIAKTNATIPKSIN
jgi:hypothetical protein